MKFVDPLSSGIVGLNCILVKVFSLCSGVDMDVGMDPTTAAPWISVILLIFLLITSVLVRKLLQKWNTRNYVFIEWSVLGFTICTTKLARSKISKETDMNQLMIRNAPKQMANYLLNSPLVLCQNGVDISLGFINRIEDLTLVETMIALIIPCVEHVNMSDKRLVTVRQFTVPSKIRLEVLDLSDNRLTEIPNEITKLEKLKTLNLSKNRLKTLPEHMESMESLQELDLSNNKSLRELPGSLGLLNSLMLISIGGTRIQGIPLNFYHFNDRGGYFDLGSSPNGFPPLECPPIDTLKEALMKDTKNSTLLQRTWLTQYWDDLIKERVATIKQMIPVVLLGRTGAGKTTFASSLVNGTPSHASESTKGFEIPREINLRRKNQDCTLRILDVAGQEFYGVLHTFLLSIGNPKDLITMVVINAEQYYQFFSSSWATTPLNEHINYMKHCGLWINTALSINPSCALLVVLTHTDLLKNPDVMMVENDLRKNIEQQLDERLSHHSKFHDRKALVSHHQLLKSSMSFIKSACYHKSRKLNIKIKKAMFEGGLEEAKKALIESTADIQSPIVFTPEWQPILRFIMSLAEKNSDALVSITSLKTEFPFQNDIIEEILHELNKQRIIFLFPESGFFCPSPVHLQYLCGVTIDHTCSDQLHAMVEDAAITGDIPVEILERLWSVDSRARNKESKVAQQWLSKKLKVSLLIAIACVVIVTIITTIFLAVNNSKKEVSQGQNSTSTSVIATTTSKYEVTQHLFETATLDTLLETTPTPVTNGYSDATPVSEGMPRIVIVLISVLSTMIVNILAFFVWRRCHKKRKYRQEPSKSTDELTDQNEPLPSSPQPVFSTALLPLTDSDNLFPLIKDILTTHFMGCSVQLRSDAEDVVEGLHLPFLLRETVPQEECLSYWPESTNQDQLTLEFAFFPLIPPGLLSLFLNAIRTESSRFFKESTLEINCIWQGGAIMSFHCHQDTICILVQGVNYSFNPDKVDFQAPLNSGPYSIEKDLRHSMVYICVRGSEEKKMVMRNWLKFAKQTLAHIALKSWPGCHFDTVSLCPHMLGTESSQRLIHESTTDMATSATVVQCSLCQSNHFSGL